MLRIKSFKLEDADKASEFMVEHMPLSTEKQSGVAYTMTHIMVTYDDGEFNAKNMVSKFKSLIEKEIENIDLHKHNLRRNKFNLSKRIPKKYKSSLTLDELIKLCAEQDGIELSQGRVNFLIQLGQADEEHQKKEYNNLTREEVKLANRVNEIVTIENSTRQSVADIEHSQEEIELYQQSIKEYDSK